MLKGAEKKNGAVKTLQVRFTLFFLGGVLLSVLVALYLIRMLLTWKWPMHPIVFYGGLAFAFEQLALEIFVVKSGRAIVHAIRWAGECGFTPERDKYSLVDICERTGSDKVLKKLMRRLSAIHGNTIGIMGGSFFGGAVALLIFAPFGVALSLGAALLFLALGSALLYFEIKTVQSLNNLIVWVREKGYQP